MADSNNGVLNLSVLASETPTPSVGSGFSYEIPVPNGVISGGYISPDDIVPGFVGADPPLVLGDYNLVNTIAGITFDENATNVGSYSIPPDPHGAVGPNHLVSVVNTSIEWHTKSGAQQGSMSLKNFFSSATNTFDPKVVYDAYNDRFVVITLERVNIGNGNTADDQSRILVSISDDADPNGTWHTYSINSLTTIGGVNTWADYPGIAVDEDAIYITNNMFQAEGAGSYAGGRLWIIGKGDGTGGAYDGGAISFTVHDPFGATGGIATTVMPTTMYGATGSVGTYLVGYSGLSDGTNEYFEVIKVENPLTTPTFALQYANLGNIENTSAAYNDAPQLGTTTTIETNDRRMFDAVWRDGSIYGATTIVGSGADAGQVTVFWAEIDVSNFAAPVVAQTGTIGGEDIAAGAFTFFPSIAVNSQGDVGIGFAASAPTIYGGAYFTWHDLADAAGTTRTPVAVQAGLDYYVRTFGGPRNRWGDYSATEVDPSDDTTFWVFNEYALTRGTSFGGEDGRYGTMWGQFALVTALPTPRLDFDGDGGDEVLFQHASNGSVQAYNGEGGFQQGFGLAPIGGVKGIGDVDNDGKDDVIVQLANGSTRAYSGAGGTIVANYGVLTGWTLLALGDFDNAGGVELLMQRDSDGMTIAKNEAGQQVSFGNLPIGGIVAVGDINGDGTEDVIARAANGSTLGYSGATGAQIANYANLGAYSILALADFDGDGGKELLIQRNSDGLLLAWNEAGLQQSFGLRPVGGVLGVGDMNGDGNDDVIIQFAGGSTRAYSGTGGAQIANYGVLSNFTVRGMGDFDGDGDTDLLIQRNTDGLTVSWNEGGRQQSYGLRPIGGIQGIADYNGDGSDDVLVRVSTNSIRSYNGEDGLQIANYGIFPAGEFIGGMPLMLDKGLFDSSVF